MGFKEWKTVRLEDICSEIVSGGTPGTQQEGYYGGTIPWVRTQEVAFNRIYDTETYITREGLDSCRARWIPENSVIVAMSGTAAGRIAINKIPLTTNQGCCNLIINPDKADYNFIYYYLLSQFESIRRMAAGTAQPNLNIRIIRELEIQLPPLEQQHKIASVLSPVDSKIENNIATNETLVDMSKALFKEWFLDVSNESGKIPEGWKRGVLGDICKTMSGGTPDRSKPEYYTDGKIGWIKSRELNNTFVIDTEEKITGEGLKDSQAKLLPPYSVLIAMYGSTVGQIGITTGQMACNQAVCAFLPTGQYPFTFIYNFLLNAKSDIMSRAVGSAQQNISQLLLQHYKLVIPPCELVQQFHETVLPFFQEIEENLAENVTLKELRDSLLAELMLGKPGVTI